MTGRVISQCKVTIIPMTETVIQTIEELAECHGMKGLKLCTKSSHILFDLAWIAGVDYYSSSDYSDRNDHEKVVYDYEEVKYKSNNEEEGKWDAKDNDQVIETDEVK